MYLSCDTARDATTLIDYYKRKGFLEVARQQWSHAMYESVVLSKHLG